MPYYLVKWYLMTVNCLFNLVITSVIMYITACFKPSTEKEGFHKFNIHFHTLLNVSMANQYNLKVFLCHTHHHLQLFDLNYIKKIFYIVSIVN